jgi:hypothetical protein
MVRVQVLLSFLLMCAKQPGGGREGGRGRKEGEEGEGEEEEEGEGEDQEEEEEEEEEEEHEVRATSMMDDL